MLKKGKFVLAASLLALSLAAFVWFAAGARSSAVPGPSIGPLSPVTMQTPLHHRYVSAHGSDAADGTQKHPWATITRASRDVVPGTTVHVAPGVYDGEIVTRACGTESARITFISDERWESKLTASGTGPESATWENRGDYVDIIGFDITGAGPLGIMNLGSHVRIIGNHVHDIPARSGCTNGMGGAGIDNGEYKAHDNEVVGNRVHDVGDYTKPCSSVHGVYHSNARGAIYNNLVYRNQGWGIHLWHAATDVIVANNDVFENGYGGIVVGAGDSPGGVINDNTIVVNNIVFRNGNYGIQEYGRTGDHNRYLNNLVRQNQRASFRLLSSKAINTVEADPCFMDYEPGGSGDYRLCPTSPAIDSGTSDAAASTDFDGNIRPAGRGWDIGAYEYFTERSPATTQRDPK